MSGNEFGKFEVRNNFIVTGDRFKNEGELNLKIAKYNSVEK